ncbi:response regulator [Halotia branconii]|uniref:Response regulator n=1 Tax=Halotia branconii CENA392 TaxID=1539056 RepID=A0AAJ6NNA9_9CYAN|nr:response regulator [Halotia branconii]WGV23556.1 response regulator [Halotia branconii CENA392]
MVVDDEQDVQLLFRQKFRRELKQEQIKLYFAFSAEEALEYLQSQLINHLALIVTDINMPGMNGLEMLKVIKDHYPNLKVFIITAYDDEYNYLTAKQYGADGYITKPIQFDKLKEKILNL